MKMQALFFPKGPNTSLSGEFSAFRPAAHALDGLVVADPVLHIHLGILGGGIADDHFTNSCVDNASADRKSVV